MIVDDQHPHLAQQFRTGIGFDILFRLGQGHLEMEAGTLAGRTFEMDVAAHQGDQALGDGQTQTRAAEAAGGGTVGLTEGVEDQLLLVLFDADTGVADLESNRPLLLAVSNYSCGHANLALLGELDRIAQQVGQHLAQAGRVAAYPLGQIRRQIRDTFDALAHGLTGVEFENVFHQFAQLEALFFQLQLAGLDLGKIEDIVDDLEQGFGAAMSRGCEPVGTHIETRIHQQLGHAEHAVHRSADLVAHGGEELALGPARGLRLFLRRQQAGGAFGYLLFQPLAIGFELAVAAFDLGQHVVEALGQQADLVIAARRQTQLEILFLGDPVHALHQSFHGLRDMPLQA